MSVFAEAITLDTRKFTGLWHKILTERHWLDCLPPIAFFTEFCRQYRKPSQADLMGSNSTRISCMLLLCCGVSLIDHLAEKCYERNARE